jgi:hypothetical protein
VFDAFKQGAESLGHTCVENDPYSDVDVIWSVLFSGRMAGNQAIWERNIAVAKPTIVLEVGGLKRGTTWKVGLHGINRSAKLGPKGNNSTRAEALNLTLRDWQYNDNGSIMICTQHDKSQQWEGMPVLTNWLRSTIEEIRSYTDRQILVRPHPRCTIPCIEKEFKYVQRQTPKPIVNTYDSYDFDTSNIYALVNWSSNTGVEAVCNGIPVFVGPNSLAYEVGNQSFETINNPLRPDRTQWFNDLAHTEYTVEEIEQGIPLKHLTTQF